MSAPRTIQAISPRTDAEWPPDHPLRRASVVLSNSAAARADYLICTLVGEERQPPAPDDHDVTGACARCSAAIVWRASAAPGPQRICWKCWTELNP